jgi:hypothetical protein
LNSQLQEGPRSNRVVGRLRQATAAEMKVDYFAGTAGG